MYKIQKLLIEHPVIFFLLLTFIISLLSFSIMWRVPATQSPESFPGLPVWLIAIWSPNIAAIVIWLAKQEFVEKMRTAFSLPQFSWWIFLSLLPLVITFCILMTEIYKGNKIEWSNFQMGYLFPLIFINLLMGPLGEELGWRSFLYPAIKSNYGWMAGALTVGIIWALWHAPLWWIDSPQSKIPFWAFVTNVLCLSILMGLVYNHSGGSVLPVILFHLTFNVSSGVIDILGSHDSGEHFTKSLYFYIPLVIILSGIHEWIYRGDCSSG